MIEKTDILDYGFLPSMLPENSNGVPARVTAAHKDRYELVCEYGLCFGRLKTSVYYGGGNAVEDFPTTGDFVLIDYNAYGDSQIIRTLPRKSFFSRLDPTPGCAVKSAIESGELPYKRWESYLKIKHEAKYSDDKNVFLRNRQELHKKWAKEAKSGERAKRKSGGNRR